MLKISVRVGMTVCVIGGAVIGFAAGYDLGGGDGQLVGSMLGMSIGYGFFHLCTGVV